MPSGLKAQATDVWAELDAAWDALTPEQQVAALDDAEHVVVPGMFTTWKQDIEQALGVVAED